MKDSNSKSSGSMEMGGIVDRNIRALVARQQELDRRRRLSDKWADAITTFAGTMRFVYIHAALFGLWILINLGWLGLPKFDPTFVVLAMVASVEAIFISTFVLITQNRMAALAEQRAELDLQVSLLAEHEITRLIQMVTQVGEKLGIEAVHDPELAALKGDIKPEKVLDQIDHVARDNGSGAAAG